MKAEKLLTILDKPKHAQTALERSLEIAQQNQAQLNLVSFCWNPLASRGSGVDTTERNAIREKVVKERKEWLRALEAGRSLTPKQTHSQVVWTDDIADWVARKADEGIDLIIKSAHPSKTLLHTPLDWDL